MRLLDGIHDRYVYGRRVSVLARHLSAIIPEGSLVLDIGCGDGRVDRLISEQRPDLRIEGIEVLPRPKTEIPVRPFDGAHVPYPDASVDIVQFVDVLHHTPDPRVLLTEARRVARSGVVIKDHLRDGFLAGPTLKFMDRVGNARHGVALPHNYWSGKQWQEAFSTIGLTVERWEGDLKLYPPWADWVFGRGLHFVACLRCAEPIPPAGAHP